MKKLTMTIKVELDQSVSEEKAEHLEKQLNHKGTQIGNLLATKVREAVKMADGEISEPAISYTYKLGDKKSTKKVSNK